MQVRALLSDSRVCALTFSHDHPASGCRVDALKVDFDALTDQHKIVAKSVADAEVLNLDTGALRSTVQEALTRSSLPALLLSPILLIVETGIEPLVVDSGEILCKASTSRDIMDQIQRESQVLTSEMTNSTSACATCLKLTANVVP